MNIMKNFSIVVCSHVILETFIFLVASRKVFAAQGKDWPQEIEDIICAQPRISAMKLILKELGIKSKLAAHRIYCEYYSQRDRYMKSMEGEVIRTGEMTEMIKAAGIKVEFCNKVSRRDISECIHKEVPTAKLIEKNVLVMGETFEWALAAKVLDVPFIGITPEWSHQNVIMRNIGVKYIITNLSEITTFITEKIDRIY